MRKLECSLVVALLLICAGFPLLQAGYEIFVDHEKPFLLNFFTQKPGKENWHRWDENAKDRSVFSKWLRPKTLQLRYDLFKEMAPKAIAGVDDWLFYNQDVDYLIDPTYSENRFYKGSFDTLISNKRVNIRNPFIAIEHFRDELKAQNIQLLIVPIPGKPSIYPEKLVRGFNSSPDSPTLTFIDDLKKSGFNVVDLFTPIINAKKTTAESNYFYLKHDTHWTPQGLEIAATVISEKISSLLLSADKKVSAAETDHYFLKDTTIMRYGDIAEMTKVPNRKKIWAEEKVFAAQVYNTRDSLLYKDDSTSTILWLGDSFSRIYQTDAPKSAGLIAHLAYHLNQPITSIVNDCGASTVVRQQLARRPNLLKGKKLVVWSFVERDIRFGSKGWQVESLSP